MRSKWEREEAAETQRREREQNLRDRGYGYLIWIARRHARLTQASLARRIGSSRSAVTRWEQGNQVPSLSTLQRVAHATGLELVIGLREPDSPDHVFVALGVPEEERTLTELRMLHDYQAGTVHVPPVEWRRKYPYDVTGFSDWIR